MYTAAPLPSNKIEGPGGGVGVALHRSLPRTNPAGMDQHTARDIRGPSPPRHSDQPTKCRINCQKGFITDWYPDNTNPDKYIFKKTAYYFTRISSGSISGFTGFVCTEGRLVWKNKKIKKWKIIYGMRFQIVRIRVVYAWIICAIFSNINFTLFQRENQVLQETDTAMFFLKKDVNRIQWLVNGRNPVLVDWLSHLRKCRF